MTKTVGYLFGYIDNSWLAVSFPTVDLKQLLLFCDYNVHFKTANQIYRQMDGVTKGSQSVRH